jgi:hypothetical protein
MIVIYHIDSKRPIIKNLSNHDTAAMTMAALSSQNIISTHRLAIADLSELTYPTYQTINENQIPRRGRKKGSKNAVRR